MEGVTRMLDEGKNVDIIYLDFAKAFDKVPHHRLIDKVASMGVEDRVKGWIQQWLEDIRIGHTLQVVSRRDRSSDQLSSLCSLMTWKMVCRVQYWS